MEAVVALIYPEKLETAEDLSDMVRMISVPQKEADRAAEALEIGIEEAALIYGYSPRWHRLDRGGAPPPLPSPP